MIAEAYILISMNEKQKIRSYTFESDEMYFTQDVDNRFCDLHVQRRGEQNNSLYNFCFPHIPVFIQNIIMGEDKHKGVNLRKYGIIGVKGVEMGLKHSLEKDKATNYNENLALLQYISTTSRAMKTKITAGNFILENDDFSGYTEVKLEDNMVSLFDYEYHSCAFYPNFVTMEDIDTDFMVKMFKLITLYVYRLKNKNTKDSESKSIDEIINEISKNEDEHIKEINEFEIKATIDDVCNKLNLSNVISDTNENNTACEDTKNSGNKTHGIKRLSDIKNLN